MTKLVYAMWDLLSFPTYDEECDDNVFDQFHVSAGVGNEQYDGYFTTDEGAILSFTNMGGGKVRAVFTAPSQGLESHGTGDDGYWLSPNPVMGVEPEHWGIASLVELAAIVTGA